MPWLPPALMFIGIMGSVGIATRLALRTLSWQDLFLWSAVAYAIAALVVLASGAADMRFVADSWWAIATGALLAGSSIAFNIALGRGQASSVVPVSGAYPVVTLALAAVALSESVSLWRCVGTVTVIGGVVLITTGPRDVRRQAQGLGWLSPTLAFVAGMGAIGVTSRLALRTLGWQEVLVWTALAFAVVAIALLAVRQAQLRIVANTRWAIVVGALLVVGLVALQTALSTGEASSVIPVTAGYPVVTLVLAATVLAEPVTRRGWAGTLLVIGGVALITGAD